MKKGYYRHPTVHGRRVIFVSEDDLWTVDAQGGPAVRLTSHASVIESPLLSPDGARVAFIAREEGAPEVHLMDAEGGPAERLALARKYGADVVIDIEEETSAEARTELVLDATPGRKGADRVFECAGFLPATPEGLGYLRKDGTFIEVGHFVDMGSLEFNINRSLMVRNCRLEAIWASQTEHFVRAMPILEKLEFPYADMVSHQLPLARVKEGFQALNGDYRLNGDTVIKIALRSDL